MPTTKKRVNLTVPAPIYERILDYKRKNGIRLDASACLQLLTQQLNQSESSFNEVQHHDSGK